MTTCAEVPRRSRRAGRPAWLAAGILLSTSAALAGGEMAERQKDKEALPAPPAALSPAAELQQHYASRQAALASTFERTAEVSSWVATRNSRRTAILRPVKDAYGDPMYAAYGQRAYAGTPWYNGPAYVSSFGMDRDIPYETLYGAARAYWPGSLSDPGYVPRTDVNLGMTAGQGYIQHGMQLTPGSLAPSYTRPSLLNATLD